MKKTRNILVSLLACLFVILAVPTAVSAAAKAPQCPKKQTLEFYNAYISGNEMPTEGDGYIYIKNLSRSAVITNVKSSNKYYPLPSNGLLQEQHNFWSRSLCF